MILFNSRAKCVFVVKKRMQRIHVPVVGNLTGLSTSNYSCDLDHGKHTLKNIELKLHKVPGWTDEICFMPLQKLGNFINHWEKQIDQVSTFPLALQCLTEIGQQRTVFPGAHRVLFMSSEFYSALLMHSCLEEPCSLEVNTVT